MNARRWLAASMLYATAYGALAATPDAGSAPPTLGDLVEASSVVAFGQVERLEHKSGRPVATMRVDYIGKGEREEVVSFFADPLRPNRAPPVEVGGYALVFLESTGAEDPKWQIVFHGQGALPGFHLLETGRVPYVASRHYAGNQFSKQLCGHKGKWSAVACTATLAAVCAEMRLPVPEKALAHPATFRIASRSCPVCDLEAWLPNGQDAGVLVCKPNGMDGRDPETFACVTKALREERPFSAVLEVQGIDSSLREAFVFDGHEAVRYWYDSSREGGGRCSASVWQTPCQGVRLRPDAGEDQQWLECMGPGEGRSMCDQISSRIEVLGEPQPVSRLHCNSHEYERFRGCTLDAGSGHTLVPKDNGLDLVCYGPSEERGGYSCAEP